MGVPVKPKPEEEKEDWLVTYSDAITLLMAFFVMLLTFAEYDIPAFEEAAKAIKENIGSGEKKTTSDQLKVEIEDVVYEVQANQAISVSKVLKDVIIDLDSRAFFKPGSAELREAAIPVLEKLAKTITAPRFETYNIQVEGHTDDEPIKTAQFPSNWELSTARAARVVRFFAEGGYVHPVKLSAAGFADQKPKVPNRDADGNPIPENQATNRRTAIRVEPMTNKEKDVWYQFKAEERAKEEELKRAQLQAGGEAAQPVDGGPAAADGQPRPQPEGAQPPPEGVEVPVPQGQ